MKRKAQDMATVNLERGLWERLRTYCHDNGDLKLKAVLAAAVREYLDKAAK